jgi:hypothetical protein
MNLDDANPKQTPAEDGALPAEKDGEPCNEGFSYPSVVGMPIYLASNSRPDIALSTMQAEYTALSMAISDLLPFQWLAIDVCRAMGLDAKTVSTIHSIVWEDNDGTLILTNLPPYRVTPRSKYYAIKLNWFRSQLQPGVIDIRRVATDEQLADIFTKGLRTEKFKIMRHKLMGW